ncbi:MAG: 16S rRNA (adenine(1518)-N(6)/adenine(1519)-N(6))-dimethyltransferase RsmA [bacterium]|nr:16S rRNA (adenine(1518)-N(6)/adenine(1519)-N(6))-dimethyltransferase RsmA [bacterium]
MPARLGQHFLTSRRALARIIDAAELTSADTVLEVGPGTGFLTEALLAHAGRVIAVEKDARLVARLIERFAAEIASGRLTLVHADIRSFALSKYKIQDTRYKLVANIPYYLTGHLLRQFLGAETQPSRMVLMLQREVAERIVARDGKESLLSISVKAYGTPRIVARTGAGAFSPPPKVDSAVLVVENISRHFFDEYTKNVQHSALNTIDACSVEGRFFAVVRAGFAHKRKLLAGNLKPLIPNAREALDALGINPRARAENLTLADWRALATHVC